MVHGPGLSPQTPASRGSLTREGCTQSREQVEAIEGIRECSSHLLKAWAEDFHMVVMIMQIMSIPSIIPLLRTFNVSATTDTHQDDSDRDLEELAV